MVSLFVCHLASKMSSVSTCVMRRMFGFSVEVVWCVGCGIVILSFRLID